MNLREAIDAATSGEVNEKTTEILYRLVGKRVNPGMDPRVTGMTAQAALAAGIEPRGASASGGWSTS